MPSAKLRRDVSYLVACSAIFPPLSAIAALNYLVRGSRRMAFQVFLCGCVTLLVYVVTPNPFVCFCGGAIVLMLVVPVVALYFLRRLDWPAPTPLKTGAWVSLGQLIILIGIIGILVAIAVPAYRTRGIRDRLYEPIETAKNATDLVANYYYKHRRWPDTLEKTGFKTPASHLITSVGISENGTVTLTIAFSPLAGKSVTFLPSIDGKKKIVWKCMSEEIEDNYLPRECRKEPGSQTQR